MKMAKDMMLVAAGVAGVLAYQRYGDKMKDKARKMVDNTVKKVDKKLECME